MQNREKAGWKYISSRPSPWCGLFLSSIGNLHRDQYTHDQLVWRPLPVRYIYPLHRDMETLQAGEPLVQRLPYTIRRLGPHAAVIMLHQPQLTTIDILRGGKTLDASFSD